ncbi:hypothetical protein N5A93_18675 [Roseovarius sp. EGI FJ00037]|uniref:hypothetical protein n=1 Tax=Roseovarius salincola TaxID=2978479 RepID=UPI0022A841EA|nr:hypothetical protein [Roseovarius sp. EGI FJ00037]MCZ0814246.1 hypothetical protein [Roseovarius sp. EGI FJ00037]
MTDDIETPKANALKRETTSSVVDGGASEGEPVPEFEVQPTLTGYFEETRASPSAFFKVLRKNKVKRFLSSDREATGNMMSKHDPDCERFWALMSQSVLPDAVDTWIWGAAQFRLKEHLGEAFDPQDHDASRIFKSVLRELSPALRSDQKEDKKRAETLLRITICWLVENRSLKAWQIAEQLQSIFFSDLKSASRLAQRAVQKGKGAELRLAVAMVGLGDQIVKAAEEERNHERNIGTDLRHRLDSSRDQVEQLHADLKNARNTIAEQEATIAKLDQTLAAERQHWGHDLTETKAEQRVLLGERLGPLLEDAIDALEIEPPAPGVALRRVKAALSAIEGAKE